MSKEFEMNILCLSIQSNIYKNQNKQSVSAFIDGKRSYCFCDMFDRVDKEKENNV